VLGFILMALRQKRTAQRGDDSDEALMERFRDGDARAFEQLLQRHEKAIFNFIYRLVRDRELAGDLTQETFLRVVKGARRYSRKAKFTTWLYTIARNQGIDALRKARHRQHPSLDQPVGGEPEGRTLLEKLPGGSADGFQAADAMEIRARVDDALGELSEEQREVFVMREFMQLPFKEIATVVGSSENTIKSRMRYALEHLRLALADYSAELPGGADPVPARSRA
jgi:RNA polymerase sigma-70 factor, ECF subfamily